MPHIRTTCPFCGCGCGLYLQASGGRAVGVSASPSHPVGRGRLCLKGWHCHEMATSAERLLTPLVRRGELLDEASWEEALQLSASRLGEIARTGWAVGALGSPRNTNEENYLLSRLARGAFRTNNIDFSERLDALPQLFDLPQYRPLTLPSARLEGIAGADLVVLWQTDPIEAHPAAGARVLRAAEQGTPLAEVATHAGRLSERAQARLRPRPGTDAALAAGVLHAMIQAIASWDRETEAAAAGVADFTPTWTEGATGVPAAAVQRLGEALAAASRPLIIYTSALTRAWRGADALLCLGEVARLAAMRTRSWPALLWLSQHTNFQGARDMGVVPYFLSGFQSVSDAEVRERFGRAWGSALPVEPGLPAWDMLDKVRGLLVLGDDPLRALPDVGQARQALAGLGFLVVVDTYLSPLAQMADVVLPGASFAEKEGTVTSAERRVQRVRQAVDPPGQARPDWWILCELARHLGHPMEYPSPQEVMVEIASLTPSYAGVSYEAMDTREGVCLPPLAEGAESPSYLSGIPTTEEGGQAPVGDSTFPLLLAVDHEAGAWLDQPGVVCSPALRRELAGGRFDGIPMVQISPVEAGRYGLREGQRVRVRSRAGEMEATAHLAGAVREGVLMLPFRMREAAAGVMPPALHPESGVPVLAPCAVAVHGI